MTTITYGVSEEKYSLGDTTRISYGIVAYADSTTDGIVSIEHPKLSVISWKKYSGRT